MIVLTPQQMFCVMRNASMSLKATAVVFEEFHSK